MAEVSNFEHFMAHREEDVSEILQLQNFPQTVHYHEFFFSISVKWRGNCRGIHFGYPLVLTDKIKKMVENETCT